MNLDSTQPWHIPWPSSWNWPSTWPLGCVTGAFVHTPRQRNSTYVQTVRRSIYETRQPEHPRSPLLQHKWRPWWPPFLVPLHVILPGHSLTLWYRYVYICVYSPNISAVITITAITAPMRQEPAHSCIRYPTLAPSSASAVPCWQPFPNGFESLVFSIWFDSIVISIWLYSIAFPIRFDSHLTYLFSIRVTKFESYSSEALVSPTLARVFLKYFNTEIMEYSTIMIIEIVFVDNILTKSKKS